MSDQAQGLVEKVFSSQKPEIQSMFDGLPLDGILENIDKLPPAIKLVIFNQLAKQITPEYLGYLVSELHPNIQDLVLKQLSLEVIRERDEPTIRKILSKLVKEEIISIEQANELALRLNINPPISGVDYPHPQAPSRTRTSITDGRLTD